MRKLQSLKEHMTAALQHRGAASNPADLYFHIPQGSLQATQRVGMGFGYSYTLVLTVLDFAHSIDEIMVPLLLWIRRWQPELLALTADRGGIAFEVEDLDDGKVDVMIRVPLSETVTLVQRPGGGFDLTRPEEPLPFAMETGEPLHAVYLDGEQIARCSLHPDKG